MELLISGIGKKYKKDLWALKNINLQLAPGIFGLLGPNGAGKSTLMDIIATITQPSEGTVKWNGIDIGLRPNVLRAVLGYLPQNFGVYPNLNPVEFLEYLAAVKGLDKSLGRTRVGELLEVVNLTDVSNRPLGGFSTGMKQRVGIAQALLNDPRLLIVDEPTAGLDPEERVRFRNLLAELSAERIVILSSHIVSDIEAVASAVGLIADGVLFLHTTPEELLTMVENKVWECVIPSAEFEAARRRHTISSAFFRSDGVHLRIVCDQPPDKGQPLSPTLEDAYLYCFSQHRTGAVA